MEMKFDSINDSKSENQCKQGIYVKWFRKRRNEIVSDENGQLLDEGENRVTTKKHEKSLELPGNR
jgi:hypothetical protein